MFIDIFCFFLLIFFLGYLEGEGGCIWGYGNMGECVFVRSTFGHLEGLLYIDDDG